MTSTPAQLEARAARLAIPVGRDGYVYRRPGLRAFLAGQSSREAATPRPKRDGRGKGKR